MTERNPLAALLVRHYFEGYSREQDEKLAEQLFYGITIRNENTGRLRHKYLPHNGPQERQGFEALQRLLLFSCQDLAPSILTALLGTLDLDGSTWGRLVLKRRKKGKRDVAADLQINFYIERRIKKGEKTEAAVEGAMAQFGLTRKAVFAARKRAKLVTSAPIPSFPGYPFLRQKGLPTQCR
jgi:hypothetical protein